MCIWEHRKVSATAKDSWLAKRLAAVVKKNEHMQIRKYAQEEKGKKCTTWSGEGKCNVKESRCVKLRMIMGQMWPACSWKRNTSQVRWTCCSERLFKWCWDRRVTIIKKKKMQIQIFIYFLCLFVCLFVTATLHISWNGSVMFQESWVDQVVLVL